VVYINNSPDYFCFFQIIKDIFVTPNVFIGNGCYKIIQGRKAMNRTHIISKYVAIGIVVLFIGTCIIPLTATPLTNTENDVPHPGSYFGLNSNIEISWAANQTEEPVIPRGPLRSVILDVSFWVTWGIFGRAINYIYRGVPIQLEVSVIDRPEWCVATLSQGTLLCIIPPLKENSHEIVHTWLSVSVADDAPAFALCPITIQTTVKPLRGPFGFITVMHGITKVVNVTFSVAYKPLIQPFFPQTNLIETPPLVQVELPIGIKNLGNGRTIVANEVVDYPEGWIVSLPTQLILEVDEYKEMNLTIIAPSNFSDEETITVSFTPHSFDNYSLVGTITYASFLVYYRPL